MKNPPSTIKPNRLPAPSYPQTQTLQIQIQIQIPTPNSHTSHPPTLPYPTQSTPKPSIINPMYSKP